MGRWREFRFCGVVFLLVLGLLRGLGAQDAVVVLDERTREVDLTSSLFMMRDASGQMTPEQAGLRKEDFQRLPKGRVNIGHTADTIWLRFTLRSEAAREMKWVIELPTGQLDVVEWFVFDEDRPTLIATGDVVNSMPGTGHRYPFATVTLAPGQEVEVGLRLHSEASIVVPLRLFSPDAFQAMERDREWRRGLFFGYVGALAILGILLAVVTRNRIYLFYALIVACLWVDGFGMTSSWAWLGLPGAAFMERQGLVMNSVLCVIFVILFQRYFFQLRQTMPRLDTALRRFLLVYMVFLAVIPFAPVGVTRSLQLVLEISVYLGTIALSLYFVATGFRPARLFFFGWLGFWMLYVFLLLQVLGVLPFLRISPNLVEISLAVGTTFFLFAVAGWVGQIQRENNRSRDRELALQREMLGRLEREVADRTADLREAKEHAEQANRFKGLFLANISHEIRTPLSTLVGLSQAMWMQSAKYSLPAEFSQFLNQIRSGGQYLNLILTNLLDVSAAEAGRTPVRWQDVSLSEWADSLRDLLEPIARNHGVRLVWYREFDSDRAFDTDPVRLTQILLNIAHNAIKLSEAGQTVEIGIRENTGVLELTVRDEGPGILESDLQAIFHAFTQSEGSSPTRTGDHGVGLGLSVVRLNVELLAGRVRAENRACGGACFTVTVPAHEPLKGGLECA